MTRCSVGAQFDVTGKLLARVLDFPYPKKRASQAIESYGIVLPQLQCLLESCDRGLPQRQLQRHRSEFELNIGIVERIVAGLPQQRQGASRITGCRRSLALVP